MVGPRVVGEGEKVSGECVVYAAKEALGAREHCRCAQVDLHRGDGGPLGSAVARAWPVRRKWNQRLHSIADDRADRPRGSTICLRYRRLVAAFVEEPACATDDSLADLTSGGRSQVVRVSSNEKQASCGSMWGGRRLVSRRRRLVSFLESDRSRPSFFPDLPILGQKSQNGGRTPRRCLSM
eukprot:scaffold1940_cov78-Phaeocystis_antarctica.AAC.4